MSEHVPNDVLADFIEGEVSEQVAIHVAEHLDHCPHCATRAATMEPLAVAFASIDDPVVPSDLGPAILAAVQAPAGGSTAELGVGIALLGAAAVLTLGAADPVSVISEIGSVLGAGEVIARSVAVAIEPFALTFTVGLCASAAAAGLALWSHRGQLERP